MACNCGTQEEIDKLYNAYSDKIMARRQGNSFKDKILNFLLDIATIISWIIAFPIMLIYVLAVLFWEENPRINIQTINLLKLFHTNERK